MRNDAKKKRETDTGRAAVAKDEGVPVVQGNIYVTAFWFLRDSQSNTILIRRGLVKTDELAQQSSPVLSVGRTEKWLSEALISVSTSYFTGSVLARCLQDSFYELVLWNAPVVRRVDDPGYKWSSAAGDDEERLDGEYE